MIPGAAKRQRNLIDNVEFEVVNRIATSEDLGQWAADVREYVQRAPLGTVDRALENAIAEDTQTVSQWFYEISAAISPAVGQQPPPPDPLVDDWGYGTVLGAGYPELRSWAATVIEELGTNERTVFEVEHLADEILDRNTNLMTTGVDHPVSPIQHEIANQLGGELSTLSTDESEHYRTPISYLSPEVRLLVRVSECLATSCLGQHYGE